MDEKKTKEEKKEVPEDKTDTTPTEDAGTKEEKEVVDNAVKAAAETKEQNDRKEKLIEREEKILDRKEALAKLGGGSPAGDRPSKPEETAGEYANKIMKNDI